MNQDNNNNSETKHGNKNDTNNHEPINIALIIGSLRAASINRRFAEYVVAQFPKHVIVNEVKISDLPLYNEEYDYVGNELPDSYIRIRNQVINADLVLIFSPELNRSIPGCLKNAIDALSRSDGDAALKKKRIAIATASPGAFGGRSCAFDLRKVLLPFGGFVLPKPEVYLSKAIEDLDENGKVISTRTQTLLKEFAYAVFEFAGD